MPTVIRLMAMDSQPPSGGCVLKQAVAKKAADDLASRLQAAVC